MMTATFGTIPFPYRQIFSFTSSVATYVTQLAARIPLVYLDKLFALPSQLIFQHVREQIPAIVRYGFAKTELTTLFPLCHRFDADILNANGIHSGLQGSGTFCAGNPGVDWPLSHGE